MKRILFVLIVLVMTAIVGASYALRQAPEWMRAALERSLGKSVTIRAIDFQFPKTFILSGVSIAEKDGLFAGEPEFTAETVRLEAVPTGLRSSELVIDEIDVQGVTVIVRKRHGRLYHALNAQTVSSAQEPEKPAMAPASAGPRTLSVGLLRVRDSRFQYADYDIAEKGFVFDCENVQARVSNFHVPPRRKASPFSAEGRVLQGRAEKAAEFRVTGSLDFSTLEGQARGQMKQMHLTYFEPYVSRVTTAVLDEGWLDLRMLAEIRGSTLSADAELEFSSLYFRSMEGENQLFGLSAGEIIDFLKDSSGRLKIPVAVRWNFGDRTVRLRQLVRSSIENSLNRTVFGNVGALLERAIVRIGQKGLDTPEKAAAGVLKKIKDFLKY